MQRSWLAVLIVGVVLSIISALNTFVFTPSMTMPMYSGMMTNMMFWFTFWPALLVASLVAIAFAVIMNYAYPPIAISNNMQLAARGNQPASSIDVIMKILKPEELRVINAVKDAGGMIRQSDITKQTNFSRLKVHRIVAKLSERGIIRVERAGKTNNIYLAEWFTKDNV